ncbi:MAG: hypothetical protein J7524_20605 [Roseofilum sp. Belize BBD 4]|nr:hypothetical protein [Roseofilum sp. Belize BBD 4]MBP0035536.1 hypothetical protein [Roseofilum sp. Belize BBD 4]
MTDLNETVLRYSAKRCISLLSLLEMLTFHVREAEISVITARDREAEHYRQGKNQGLNLFFPKVTEEG